MKNHPLLRAYLAGTAVPNVMMLLVLSGFIVVRYVCGVPAPLERVLVFPLAVVPNLFGVWNIFYVAAHGRGRHWPIGLHGALLPFILAPLGTTLASSLGFLSATPAGVVWFGVIAVPYGFVAGAFTGAIILYYLVWKYVVGFLNGLLGIA